MAVYAAIGTGPISFLDGNLSQKDLPLSAVFFTPNGVDASASPYSSGATGPIVAALLQQLVSQGLITPATLSVDSSGAPTMTITANIAGAPGNGITVNFTSPSISDGTVNVAVTATEVYAGLTPDTLGAALGTTAANATGLIYVQSQTAGAMPENTPSEALGAGPEFELSIFEADNTTKAFTLAATNTAADASLIKVGVSLDPLPNPGPPATFTVTANWSKSVTGVTLASLESTNPFSYVISFNGPVGALPGPGVVTLQGGTNAAAASGTNPAVAAKPATASIYSAS